MAFLRVVEVLPPLFQGPPSGRIQAAAALDRFAGGVRNVRDLGDVFLVARVKRENVLKVDPVHAAAFLRAKVGVNAAPVVVVRDYNRPQFLSTMLTCISMGLRSAMVAWGDDYSSGHATNVRDYADLAAAIREVSSLRSRAGSQFVIFAPVDVEGLATDGGVRRAKERLKAGADYLLAQPPTTDAGETFERHSRAVRRAGLGHRVIPGVFHFKDERDVKAYEAMFEWRLPRALHEAARYGEGALVRHELEVVRRLVREGFPGVYLSTRGEPAVAKLLL